MTPDPTLTGRWANEEESKDMARVTVSGPTLTDEELAEIERAVLLPSRTLLGTDVLRLIAALRASRAEVDILKVENTALSCLLAAYNTANRKVGGRWDGKGYVYGRRDEDSS